MLKIRFQRTGRKKLPFFRLVLAEHSKPVLGKFQEILGHFNPETKELSLKKDRITYWISVGAAPTDRVARLCAKEGIQACEKFIEKRVMKPSKAELERVKQEEENAKITEAAKLKAAEVETTPSESVKSENDPQAISESTVNNAETPATDAKNTTETNS